MKYNIIPVQTPKATDARLYTYILDNFEEIDSNRTRPLVLICPGGGYKFTSDRERRLQYSILPEDFMPASCATA